MLLEYGYMRNNLLRLGGYPTHQDVADMSNRYCFDFVLRVKGNDALTETSPFKEKWDIEK